MNTKKIVLIGPLTILGILACACVVKYLDNLPSSAQKSPPILATVVEEYPLVYPEWEYDVKGPGCPYRFRGIKVTVEDNKPVYLVTETSDLPKIGNTVLIEPSSLPNAKLGTLADMAVYHASKLKYKVVVNYKGK